MQMVEIFHRYQRLCHDICQLSGRSLICKTPPVVHQYIDYRCSKGDGLFDKSNTHHVPASQSQKGMVTE